MPLPRGAFPVNRGRVLFVGGAIRLGHFCQPGHGSFCWNDDFFYLDRHLIALQFCFQVSVVPVRDGSAMKSRPSHFTVSAAFLSWRLYCYAGYSGQLRRYNGVLDAVPRSWSSIRRKMNRYLRTIFSDIPGAVWEADAPCSLKTGC